LSAGDVVSTVGAKVVSVALSSADIKSLKSNSQLVTGIANSYVTFAAGMIQDAGSVGILASSSAVQASPPFVVDASNPSLLSFSLNADTGMLAMTFDEPVDASSFVPGLFRLQDSAGGGGASLTLSASTAQPSASVFSTVVSVTLVGSDLDTVKDNPTFGKLTTNTFIAVSGGGIKDVAVAPNPVNAITIAASSVVLDATGPNIVSFTLSLDGNGLLELSFN
jgi:hypothetical protein